MSTTKPIHTLRPYYIDVDRLYDVYSTVMDGYSNSLEVLEITKNSTTKNKRMSGIGELTISSLINSSSKSGISGEWGKSNEFHDELQLKTVNKLSPCVLLNWMIDKMLKDKRILETTTRWLHRPITLHTDALGQPIILRGRIVTNSIKQRQGLEAYPHGVKGIMHRITDVFTSDIRKKLDAKRKFLLITGQNHFINSFFQQVRLEAESLCDMYMFIPESAINQNKEFYSKLLSIIELLELELKKDFFMQAIKLTINENEIERIIETINQLTNLYLDREDSLDLTMRQLIQQLSKVRIALDVYQKELKKHIQSVDEGGYGYVFDLKEQMYYDSSSADILNAPQINCFGLIKNIGTYMYELEVIALYQ